MPLDRKAELIAKLGAADAQEARRQELLGKLSAADAVASQDKPETPSDIGGALQTGLESYGKAATFGFLPKLQALSDPATQAGLKFLLGDPAAEADEKLRAQGFTINETEPTFAEREAAHLQRQAAQEEAHPTASMIGTGAGVIGSVIPGGLITKGLGKVAGAVVPGLKSGMGMLQGASPVAARMASLGAEGATLGAVQAAGEGQDIESGAKMGAAFGAGLPVAGRIASGLGKVSKGALRVAFGPREEAIERLLLRGNNVVNAKTADEIAEEAYAALGELRAHRSLKKKELIGDIQEGLINLKNDVIKSSDEALNLIDPDFRVPKQQLVDILKKEKQKLILPGASSVTVPSRKAAASELDNFIAAIDDIKDPDLTGVQLKSIVKSIDENVDFLQNPAQFSKSPAQRVLASARGQIDGILKAGNKPYANAMVGVANKAKFLDEISSKISTAEATEGLLEGTGRHGKDIRDEVLNRFTENANINGKLNEWNTLKESADHLLKWQDQNLVKKIPDSYTESAEFLRKGFDTLGKLSNRDFVTVIDDLRAKTEFQRQFLRGSRNANIWTALVGGGGGLLGGPIIGIMAGSAIGASIDQYGPAMAMKIVRGVSKIKGMPTVQKIANLDLPDNIKKNLISDLKVTYGVKAMSAMKGDEDEGAYIPPAGRSNMEFDIKHSQNLSPVDKAKMLTDLRRTGRVRGLQKLMFSEAEANDETTSYKQPESKARKVEDVADMIKNKRKQPY